MSDETKGEDTARVETVGPDTEPDTAGGDTTGAKTARVETTGGFQLQVASDLHLEFHKNPIKNWRSLLKPSAPNLALVGDLCELHHKKLWCGFIERLVPHWEHIFVVNGNHEFYVANKKPNYTVSALKAAQKRWVEKKGWTNVHILEKESFDVGEVRVLGCTLWSRVPVWAQEDVAGTMNDYRQIVVDEATEPGHKMEWLSVADTNRWHEAAVRWLYDEIKATRKYVVVLTHHAPLMSGTSAPEYEVKGRALTHGFATELSALFRPEVKAWVFGHTHYAADFPFRGARVVSNPKGYSDGECGFSRTKVVTLETRASTP